LVLAVEMLLVFAAFFTGIGGGNYRILKETYSLGGRQGVNKSFFEKYTFLDVDLMTTLIL
jgi:hypothetical protein